MLRLGLAFTLEEQLKLSSVSFFLRRTQMAYRARKRATRRSGRPARQIRRKRVTARRRGPTTTRPRKQACVCPGELTPTAKFLVAQLDPFDPKCLGAKVPDSNSMPSIANADTDQVALTTVATQTFRGFAFWPTYTDAVLTGGYSSPTAQEVTWSTATATSPAVAATWSNRRNQSNIVSAIEGARAVAHGIRLSCSISPTTASGFVHVGIATESRLGPSSSEWELPKNVSEMTGLAFYKRYTIASLTQTPVTIINKWIDDTAFRYNLPTSQNRPTSGVGNHSSFEFGGSWGQLVVIVEGAPANANVLSAEHILLSELLPKKESFILGTAAAPNSPDTMSVVSTMVAEQDFAHTENQQQELVATGVMSAVRAAAESGMDQAGNHVLNRVVLPTAQAFGYNVAMAGMGFIAQTIGRGLAGVNNDPSRLALNTR